jgi:excisionase family DNA binding protein
MNNQSVPGATKSEKVNDALPPADQLITLDEAAAYCGLSYSYLGQIAQKGRLRAWKLGMQWFTTRQHVDAYIQSRKKVGAYRDDLVGDYP